VCGDDHVVRPEAPQIVLHGDPRIHRIADVAAGGTGRGRSPSRAAAAGRRGNALHIIRNGKTPSPRRAQARSRRRAAREGATVHDVTLPEADRFTPFGLTIHAGDAVTSTNNDGDDHTVISDAAYRIEWDDGRTSV
jgi:hypothetical protein